MKFADFFEAMRAARVDYVLVGGLAVSLHGVVRGTLDVDVVLAMDEANLARFAGRAPASSTDWTPEQTLDWMDSFRSLLLGAGAAEAGIGSAYERIRRTDPMRQVGPASSLGNGALATP